MNGQTDQLGARISVIVPTYNGERFLREALESAFAQTLRPCEIIVVDDCSRDGTFELAQSIAKNSPIPMRVLRLPKNSGGPAQPINAGIAQARGELISVLDQDDVFAPDHLASKTPVLASRPDVSVVVSWCGRCGDELGQPKQRERLQEAILRGSLGCNGFRLASAQRMLSLNVRWGMLFVGYPAFVFRKSDWQRKGGVDESLRIASDFDLLGWLLLQGDCAVIPQVGYYRREHDGNVCLRRADVYLEAAIVRIRLLFQSAELRRDTRFIADLRREMLKMARAFEQGALYAHATQMYFLAHQLGRRRAKTAVSLAKLQWIRLYDWISGRAPVHSRYTSPTSTDLPQSRAA
jgi:glycosyltransferase involved in cell wall biosynthesis